MWNVKEQKAGLRIGVWNSVIKQRLGIEWEHGKFNVQLYSHAGIQCGLLAVFEKRKLNLLI